MTPEQSDQLNTAFSQAGAPAMGFALGSILVSLRREGMTPREIGDLIEAYVVFQIEMEDTSEAARLGASFDQALSRADESLKGHDEEGS